MKRLLAVSWSLPPLLGARSVQVGRTLNALASYDWKIKVLTAALPSYPADSQLDFQLADQYLRNLEVVRIKAPLTYTLLFLLRKFFPKLAPMPDDQVVWIRRLMLEVKNNFQQEDFEALITFGHPWSDHLAGLQIQQYLNIPWIAHFSDPWSDNPYYLNISKKQLHRMQNQEKAVIRAADSIIFTNPATVNLVMKKYPGQLKAKVSVIPHGFEKKLVRGVRNISRKRHKLRIVHTGNLYGPRSPEGLLKAIATLKNKGELYKEIEVSFVGQVKYLSTWQSYITKNQLSTQVRFSPSVSYRDSLKIASEADVLLLIDAPNDRESVFLPSKLIDYLVYNRPILGLTPKKGVSAELLRKLGCPVAPPDDPGEIASTLGELIHLWKLKRLRVGKNFKVVSQKYDIRRTTHQLNRILNSLI